MPGSIATPLKSLTPDTNACSQAEDTAVVLAPLFFRTSNFNRKQRVDKWLFILFSCGPRSFLLFRLRCMIQHHSACGRVILYGLFAARHHCKTKWLQSVALMWHVGRALHLLYGGPTRRARHTTRNRSVIGLYLYILECLDCFSCKCKMRRLPRLAD